MITTSKKPICILIKILIRTRVKKSQTLSGFDILHPMYKRFLILEKAKDGFDVVDGRSQDCDLGTGFFGKVSRENANYYSKNLKEDSKNSKIKRNKFFVNFFQKSYAYLVSIGINSLNLSILNLK